MMFSDTASFLVLVAVVAMSALGLVTPLLALRVGTKLAVAAVSVPHVAATALRFWLLRKHVDRRLLWSFGLMSAAGGLAGALLFARSDCKLRPPAPMCNPLRRHKHYDWATDGHAEEGHTKGPFPVLWFRASPVNNVSRQPGLEERSVRENGKRTGAQTFGAHQGYDENYPRQRN